MRVAPVLLYHTVCPPPKAATSMERRLFLRPDRFDRHLDDLSRRGFHSLSLGEYAAALDQGFPPKTLLITFDDAYAHVGEIATPLLRRHGFKAVMFAPFEELGGCNSWDSRRSQRLATLEIATTAQLRSLDPDIWEVASHGPRHVNLCAVSSDRRRSELTAARERLSEVIGRPVLDLAYPYGANDESVRRDAQRAGYRMGFAVGNGSTVDRFQLPRWPISGEDCLEILRLKTSAWSFPLYRTYAAAPPWVRRSATTLLRKAV